jgi:hypothetical protein
VAAYIAVNVFSSDAYIIFVSAKSIMFDDGPSPDKFIDFSLSAYLIYVANV